MPGDHYDEPDLLSLNGLSNTGGPFISPDESYQLFKSNFRKTASKTFSFLVTHGDNYRKHVASIFVARNFIIKHF
jgi:hypothetical protein